MSTPLAVRSAGAADEDAVVALWRASGLVASYNDPNADFQFAMNGPASDVLIGEDGAGDLVGAVMVGHDGHRGWLYYVSATPACRCAGIGRAMVSAAEAWLRARGVPKVQLMVRETNSGVVGFYERLGFESTPRIVMAKWLDK
ncbi:GNAT family acetyltransferase [Camelimonas fluminis]|uniref:GNAT family acetyltransferase n=1 Tax=Camelimonas fluminis TaxID=1576911 RepID=A0ABV7UNE8_9HYPH|nr:GNAT family acetyltransferase [Camelimonas fluminis]GHE65628.1 GNAT family acetyltransferase [Camelimonas fluminis]